MSNSNPRANRFRKVASQSLLLPPPLPLINLPEESRLARTGIQNQRPMHLPVRRHIPNAVAVAALKANADGGPKCPEDFDNPQPPKREPILIESRALLECEAEEYEELEVLARLHVYEYNQPDIFRNSSAPDDTLIFDSLFEGGNLQRAERIFRKTPKTGSATLTPQQEYEMLIHPDIKNGAYRQWFYFEVRNGRPGIIYRFALVNLAKSGALFGQGLQPVIYSEHDAATKGVGWRHRGSHVRYDVAPTAQPGPNALTFHYQFEHENDCVYFACIQPYTYTDLMDYLEQLERDPQRSLTCRRTELCQSLAGNPCDLLSITSPGKDGIPPDERRIIVLSARVHPGEPNSSWMMQGMLDYLTGSSSGATILRRHFIFKVMPMLNPDGVINGNTRVSLAGWDLNRKWSNPIEQLFPTVYHLKQQLAHFQAYGRVAIYCDLHGHSINRNIFMYGCYTTKKKPSGSDSAKSSAADAAATTGMTTSPVSNTVKTDPRVFPMIVARHVPCFSFASCDFSVHKSKLTTARVVVNQELGVTNSYTLEASFCGPDFGVHKDTQFSTWDLEEMGRSWCQSLLVYYGLTAQVKALDAERERQAAIGERIVVPSPTGRQMSRARAGDGLLRMETEDEESRLARDLLLDCEAAISALFSHSGKDVNDRVGSEDDAGGMDSDLSGAEDEPIPPSPDRRAQQHSPEVQSERKKQQDDDAVNDAEGYSSAPEDFPSRKNRTKPTHTRKKPGRRKHTRNSASKQKSAAIPTSRKGDGKTKKKKKRKSKLESRRTSLVAAAPAPPLGPKVEYAAPIIAEQPPDIVVRSSLAYDVLKTFPKKVTTSRCSKSKSGRPKSSYETPRSISSAILKATMNAELAASRASLRLRPMTECPNTSNTLLVLPSVLDGSNRSGSVRMLKTAPSYDQEYPTLEEKTRFSLARVRSELPALQNSGRDEEQQRHLRHWGQENDDIRSDEASDASSERSEPEAYTSSF